METTNATKTATLVKSNLPNFLGTAHLYRLTPPMVGPNSKHHEYVAVSAIDATFSGSETHIFPADETGNVTNWIELEGSFQGEMNHAKALQGAGYSIAS